MNDISKLLEELATEKYSTSYSEGSELLVKVCEKISSRYSISILCLSTRPDAKGVQLHGLKTSPRILADFIMGILSQCNGIKDAMKLVPPHFLMKYLKPTDKYLYMLIGAAGFAVISYVLMHVGI